MNIEYTELTRLKNRFFWSVSGLRATWLNEKSFRQWSYLNVLSFFILASFDFTLIEILLLCCLGFFVLICELFNSAIEATVDYISEDRHPLAKLAKDTSSAAVFLSAVVWGGAWLVIVI